MKIIIDLELSPFQKKIVRTAVVAGAVVGALGLGLALAAPKHTFATGNTLSASDMNDNFTDLDTRLGNVEKVQAQATADGGYSLGANYCGATPVGYTGAIQANGKVGYPAARDLCKAVQGCNSAAHMCSAEELSRSAQLGVIPPVNAILWFSTMAIAALNPVTREITDCAGWTFNTDSSQYGATVVVDSLGHLMPSGNACNVLTAIACCN